MTPARFRMGQNKKPQPETTPSRFPGAAALPLARRWTVRRHDPNGALSESALQASCQVGGFVNFNDLSMIWCKSCDRKRLAFYRRSAYREPMLRHYCAAQKTGSDAAAWRAVQPR
jgi:hypothetical protein